MILLNPQPSEIHPGHYSTFLAMCELEHTKLLKDDSAIPSSQASDLGRCPDCPTFSFLSSTEKKRHKTVLHRCRSKAVAQSKPSIYACVCGQRLIYTYQLRLHKKAAKHTCKRKQKNSSHSTASAGATKGVFTLQPVSKCIGDLDP